MPKQPSVSHATTKEALLATPGLITEDGKIVGPAQGVWREVANALENKLKPAYLYTFFHGNRHNSREEYCSKYDVNVHIAHARSSSEEEDVDNPDEADNQPPIEEFVIEVDPATWLKFFKPIMRSYQNKRGGCRRIMVLPPFQWEDKLVELLWLIHKLPCAYAMQHSIVYSSVEAPVYIKIEAKCNECSATATGTVFSEPKEGEAATIMWKAPNTTKIPHMKKRQLARERSSTIGQALQGQSSTEFRKDLANQTMSMGDLESPLLYTGPVLRKCKQKARHKKLQTHTGSNVAENLQKMKYTEPYVGSIFGIGKDKFFVHYFSPSQLLLYKSFCKTEYSTVSIDATGGVAARLATPIGKSGHLFLYEVVIRTEQYQVAVLQMLSEKQDANSILYWLNEWLRATAPPPKEVVIDNSAALKSAVVRAFARCSDVAEYKKTLFVLLTTGEGTAPSCFLRLDVSHFLAAAAKWEVWKTDQGKRLKPFYQHCLGLLIKTLSIMDFEFILFRVFFLAGCTHEGEEEEDEAFFNSCLKDLTDLIKGQEIPPLHEESDIVESEDREEIEDEENCLEIEQFIKKIQTEAKDKMRDAGRLNPYFAPEVEKEFFRLGKDFVLWTGTCVSLFKSPYGTPCKGPKVTASSAPVESDFSSLKRNTLRGASGLMRADTVVATHLTSLEGSCKIAGAHQKRISLLTNNGNGEKNANSQNDSNSGDEEPQRSDTERAPGDLDNTENWKGLGIIPKRRKRESTYLKPNPSLEVALKNKKLKVPKRSVLRNGNLMPFHEMPGGQQVQVINTCPFDVFCQILASSYINYESCRTEQDNAANGLFKVSRSLAVNGAVTETYVLRASFLSEKHTLSAAPSSGRESRSRKRSIMQLVYDCFCTIQEMAEKVLECNATVTGNCNHGCEAREEWLMMPADVDMLELNGIQGLQEAVNKALNLIDGPEHKCVDGSVQRARENVQLSASGHVFVDIDIYGGFDSSNSETQVFQMLCLKDIPVELNFAGKKFILSGIAARHPPNHYVAICRSSDGRWQLFNDLQPHPQSVQDSARISPLCLCYVKVE